MPPARKRATKATKAPTLSLNKSTKRGKPMSKRRVAAMGHGDLVAVLEEITPSWAADLLQLTGKNRRNLSRGHVGRLAAAMKRGEWEVNGETIKIDPEGNVLDGQHRLTGVVKSKTPIQTYVIYNLPEEVFKTIDTGKGRSLYDLLCIDGEENPRSLSSGLSWLWRWDHDYMWYNATRKAPTKKQLETFLEKHPALRDATPAGTGKLRGLLPTGVIVLLNYLFRKKSKHDTNLFFDGLVTGAGLSKSDPILLLRDKLVQCKSRSGMQMSAQMKAYLTITAWNHFRRGTRVKYLRPPALGGQLPPFPKPV